MKFELPSTRFYGSKRRLIPWIWDCIRQSNIDFESVLDLFGGSAVFSYFLKTQNKEVYYNDLFKFNYYIGKALIENKQVKIDKNDIEYVLGRHSFYSYPFKISRIYDNLYFPDDENETIDIVAYNISKIDDDFKRSVLYYILIQSCIIKRPFNLFHRNNLSIRMRDVPRRFGNKITWERSFRELFERFAEEINKYVFDNKKKNTANNYSALECPIKADLIYLDPPYIDDKSHVSYHTRYHFLEALVNYGNFENSVDLSSNIKRLNINNNLEFDEKKNMSGNLKFLIEKYADSSIVLSYRTEGIPSIEAISEYFHDCKINFNMYDYNHSYALHKSNGKLLEVLFVTKPS